MKFGVALPTYSPADGEEVLTPKAMFQVSELAEKLRFQSLWVWDHLQRPGWYKQSWLEPLSVLTAVAARTRKLQLGTAVLVLPLRTPAILAKTVATMEFISGGRFILGIGTGASRQEFSSCGVPVAERGRRTTEYLDIVKRLLTEPKVTYNGEFFQFENISIEPRPARPPRIYIGGGSQVEPIKSEIKVETRWKPHPLNSAIERIVKYADGWLTRPSTSPELLRQDWARISARAREVGRDPNEIQISHANYLHLMKTKNRDKALEEQKNLYDKMSERGWEHCKEVYFTGTRDDILEKIADYEKSGVQEMFLHPLSVQNLPRQLREWKKEIVPHFKKR
jgi:alkanesulfonate monooxygenase